MFSTTISLPSSQYIQSIKIESTTLNSENIPYFFSDNNNKKIIKEKNIQKKTTKYKKDKN